MHLPQRDKSFLLLIIIMIMLVAFCLTASAQNLGERSNGTIPQAIQQLTQSPTAVRIPNLASTPQDDSSGPSSPAVTVHERFATFLAGNEFKAQLLIQNLRLDVPVTVVPALIVTRGEIPLEPITLPAHTTRTVDVNAALQANGLADTRGAVVVRYNFNSYGAVSAVVISSDESHWLYLNSVAESREEFWYGTTLDAVLWAPQEGVHGFISLVNTSSEPRVVHATFVIRGHSEKLPAIAIAPRQFRFVSIDELLARSRQTGAGIHLAYQGNAGDIVAEGALFKKDNGFAKYVRFMDTSLKFASGTLRSNFLLLGRQPAPDGFPAQVAFRSVAVVRNVDTGPIQVTPTIRYLRGESVQTISLKSLTLGIDESALIDFEREQRAGNLPTDFSQGTLELISNTQHTSIISELFNFDQRNGGYVVGSSFSAHPARATGSIWRIDGSFQTTVVIENTAMQSDEVRLRLFSDNGTYEKIFPVAAGGILKIDLRELQQNSARDKDGHLLTATSGTLSLSGAHGVASALTFDKLIHSADASEYVGLLAQPCNFVTSIEGTPSGSQNPFPLILSQFWTDGEITTGAASGTGTSNSNLISVSNNGNGDMATFLPNGDGSVQSVTLSFQQTTTTCDICSGDTLTSNVAFAGRTVTYISNSCTVDPNSGVETMVASWGVLGSCALSATGPPLQPGGSCVVNGSKNCYKITTSTCQTTFCPGQKRVVDSACQNFLDAFPFVVTKFPAGCN